MFDRLGLLFSLAPISRGFLAMILSGFGFPLCGVMVLRLDLVPMRYMLMHGVILGGAISLALSLPLVPVSVVINLLLILAMLMFNKNQKFGLSGASAGAMIFSMALASIIMHIKDVPAKDTLSLMWGSPFALTKTDVFILGALAVLLTVYVIFNYKNIITLFFNSEIALSLGIKVKLHRTFMILVIALVIALAMKLLGAFLIDSLLILPVLSASSICGRKINGIKNLFILSSIFGLCFALFGYVLAVMINWPPAATISLVATIFYICTFLIGKQIHKINS